MKIRLHSLNRIAGLCLCGITTMLFVQSCRTSDDDEGKESSFNISKEYSKSTQGFGALIDEEPHPPASPTTTSENNLQSSTPLVISRAENLANIGELDNLLQDKPPEKDESPNLNPGSEEAQLYKKSILTSLSHLAPNFKARFVGLSKIIAVEAISDGTIYIAERYRIWKIQNNKAWEILSYEKFKESYNRDLPKITSIHYSRPLGLLVGCKDGTTLRFLNNEWGLLEGGPSIDSRVIYSISSLGNSAFIGSKGFYEWNGLSKKFLKAPPFKNTSIRSITRISEEELLVVTRNAIISYNSKNRSITPIYLRDPSLDGTLYSISKRKSEFILASSSGISIISKQGRLLKRIGGSYSIKKISALPGGDSLLLDSQGSLHLLTANNQILTPKKSLIPEISSISLRAEGNHSDKHILGFSSGAVLEISNSNLRNWIKANPKEYGEFPTKSFPDACAAAKAILGERRLSGTIQQHLRNNSRLVFFEGRQVCPYGIGYSRPDGSTATLSNNQVELSFKGKFKSIQLDNDIQADTPIATFLDAEGIVYLGTQHGLYSHTDNRWIKEGEDSELGTDLISDIYQDKNGSIWVGTRSPKIETETEAKTKNKDENEKHLQMYHPLHLKIDSQWHSLGMQSGIRALGITGIKDIGETMWLSTTTGLQRTLASGEMQYLGARENIKKPIIEFLSSDIDGRLWFGHGFFLSGLSWMDEEFFYTTNKKNGLFSNTLSYVAEDDEKRIWVMDTNGAVTVYDYKTLIGMADKFPIRLNSGLRLPFLR